jgi:hypothetical protein
MATTYSTLKTEITDYIARNDLTSVVDTFIDLCESEMQRELKLLTFETTGTVTVTAGVGALPTGFSSMRAISWEASPDRMLRYVPPQELERANASDPVEVNYYTITGSSIKTADDGDGTLNLTYMAAFTPLSDSNTTNAILTSHPSAYLYGSLVHAAVYVKDFEGAVGYRTIFSEELKQIKRDNNDKKFAGQLVVRVA